MNTKNYSGSYSSIVLKPIGFMLLNVFAFLSIFTSFSTAYSQLEREDSKTFTETSFEQYQNLQYITTEKFDKINEHSKLYLEESEVLEIDEYIESKSHLFLSKKNSNNLLLSTPNSTKRDQEKLYITFCCLRIHLA